MSNYIQSLGWVVRRTEDPMPQGEFYRDVVGLAEVRRRDTDQARNIMLWAGMFTSFETIWQGQRHPPVETVEDAEVVPIFRVRDLELVRQRLEAANTRFVPASSPRDDTLYFTDPDGFVSGIRAPEAGSDLAPDMEADSLWPDKVVSIPDVPPLGDGVQDIGWLRMHVADPQALAPFYTQTVGMDLLENNGAEGVSLHMGSTTTLELKPGGKSRPTPGDRKELPDVWIFRGYGFDGFTQKMADANVPLVNELTLGGGSLNYYADPEGHVFGFQERRAYIADDPLTHRPEDRVARAAWDAERG